MNGVLFELYGKIMYLFVLSSLMSRLSYSQWCLGHVCVLSSKYISPYFSGREIFVVVFLFQDLVAYQENCKKALSLIERNSQSVLKFVTSSKVLHHFDRSVLQKMVTEIQFTFQVIFLLLGIFIWTCIIAFFGFQKPSCSLNQTQSLSVLEYLICMGPQMLIFVKYFRKNITLNSI